MSASLDAIIDLLITWGDDPYDEQVTQIEHALQCAALAAADGAHDALITAALLHDVGHLFEIMQARGPDTSVDRRHEITGAELLRTAFGDDVVAPVALHVQAKRYLAAVDPAHAASLSEGSQRSLIVQGGPLDADDCAEFLARPGALDAVRLRRWDDAGKVVGLEVRDLDHWLPVARRAAIA